MLLTARRRSGRTLFLMYVCTLWIAVLAALPMASAAYLVRGLGADPAAGPQWFPPRSPERSFAQLDRNGDHALDKSEAAPVPGLSANFERADVNEDGRLDPAEYSRALLLLPGWK